MTRRTLDRESVVREAALLADRDGLESLTLSVLAAHLGVKPPSLYNHIESLAALRRDLQLSALVEFTDRVGEVAMGHSGREALQRMAKALFALARERPGMWAVLQRAPAPEDAEMQGAARRALKPFESVVRPMGISASESVHLLRALRALVHGFASLEAMGGFGLPEAVDKSFAKALDKILSP
jgi:AcrR family transcriptional regulator